MSPRARVKVPFGTPACRPDCKKMRPKTIPKAAVIAPDDEIDLPF
jgi:hypothetical protein